MAASCMDGAGYSPGDIAEIHRLRDYYLNIREIVRRASGETSDLKPYEADMRYLIDTYIEADAAKKVFSSGNVGLLELIEQLGIEKAVDDYFGTRGDIVAETIENNIRKKIVTNQLSDPVYFEEMSALLQEVIDARKAKAIE